MRRTVIWRYIDTLPSMSRNRFIAACVAAGVAFWLALRGVDIRGLLGALSAVRIAWLLAAIASVALTVATAVLRWRVIAASPQYSLSWQAGSYGLIVGQMFNILLPIRLGEMVRTWLVTRYDSVPAARVLTTILVEKLLDISIVGALSIAVLTLVAVPSWLVGPGHALAILAILTTSILLTLTTFPMVLRPLLGRLQSAAPERWRAALERNAAHALDALASLRGYRRRSLVCALSLAVVCLAASTNLFLFRAFALPVPAVAAVVLFVALQAGNGIVSVPGNIGVFHYVTVLVLSAYSVDRTTGVPYALVLYAVALVPKLIAGAIVFGIVRPPLSPEAFSTGAELAGSVQM